MLGSISYKYSDIINILHIMFENFKDSLYNSYQNSLISLRDFIDTLINSDISETPKGVEDNLVSEDDKTILDNYYNNLDSQPSGPPNNYDLGPVYKSPYFWIGVASVAIPLILGYYQYENNSDIILNFIDRFIYPVRGGDPDLIILDAISRSNSSGSGSSGSSTITDITIKGYEKYFKLPDDPTPTNYVDPWSNSIIIINSRFSPFPTFKGGKIYTKLCRWQSLNVFTAFPFPLMAHLILSSFYTKIFKIQIKC